MVRDKRLTTLPGLFMLLVLLGLAAAALVLGFVSIADGRAGAVLACFAAALVLILCLGGLIVVHPNQAKVVQLFGRYVGTVRDPGFHWVNPFTTRAPISLRVRNFESGRLKVNDHVGNPIEIAAVVVWRVTDAAEAAFEVDDYQHFVHVQSEAALRNLATSYPYDAHRDGEVALRSHTAEVATQLQREIQERLDKAGVQVLEARISHLAYAPEIASAMLQRQQASAIVAARHEIVHGAVGMVEMALHLLADKDLVRLDEERKAAMVSNLLVVLCGDRNPTPVVNAGTLYGG